MSPDPRPLTQEAKGSNDSAVISDSNGAIIVTHPRLIISGQNLCVGSWQPLNLYLSIQATLPNCCTRTQLT